MMRFVQIGARRRVSILISSLVAAGLLSGCLHTETGFNFGRKDTDNIRDLVKACVKGARLTEDDLKKLDAFDNTGNVEDLGVDADKKAGLSVRTFDRSLDRREVQAKLLLSRFDGDDKVGAANAQPLTVQSQSIRALEDQIVTDEGKKPVPFLDCLVGPAPTHEHRLLRGHMIVAGLSLQAKVNVTGKITGVGVPLALPYDGLEDDAADILVGIERAEFLLRRASKIDGVIPKGTCGDRPPYLFKDLATCEKDTDLRPFTNTAYDDYQRAKRIAMILRLAGLAEKPTFKRAKKTVGQIITVVGSGGVGFSQIKSILKDVARFAAKAAAVNHFGVGQIKDSRKFLDGIKDSDVTKEHWKSWDGNIEFACTEMAEVLEVPIQHCIPEAK